MTPSAIAARGWACIPPRDGHSASRGVTCRFTARGLQLQTHNKIDGLHAGVGEHRNVVGLHAGIGDFSESDSDSDSESSRRPDVSMMLTSAAGNE